MSVGEVSVPVLQPRPVSLSEEWVAAGVVVVETAGEGNPGDFQEAVGIVEEVEEAGIGEHEELERQKQKVRRTPSRGGWDHSSGSPVFRIFHSGYSESDDFAWRGLVGNRLLFRIPLGSAYLRWNVCFSVLGTIFEAVQDI